MFKTLNMRKCAFAAALLLPLCLAACQKEAPQMEGQTRKEITGHVLGGSDDSPVRIEVFSDLQCSACRGLFIEIIQPLMREYQDKLSVVYYEFPLNIHPYARPAARYAAAANKLGRRKLLSVYEEIFKDQEDWAADGSLENSVSKALSGEDFQRIRQTLRDADSMAEINETIEKEIQLGMSKGVSSTPTLFISHGGREQKIEGRPTYQVMKQFLDPILKRNGE